MRNAYLAALYDLAKKDNRILALVADNGAIVYDKYRQDFGDRFINFGIAESNMISVAAGLAACGKIPFTYTISNFLTMRAFEQIRNDVCMQKMNVKLVGIGVGFVYSNLGPTHHSVEDIALMRTLPSMTIFSPADPLEAKEATIAAAEIQGPVYLRLATSRTPIIYKDDYEFKAGKGVILREGRDVSVITTGNITHEVIQAVDEAANQGISVRLINLHTLKPIDQNIIVQASYDTGAILTIEEHTIHGGLGSSVAAVLLENNALPVKFKRLGLDDFPSGYGTYQEMKEINGLSKEDITGEIKTLYEAKKDKKSLIDLRDVKI
ncbi:MAG: transketolase [Candidatus Omnitrophota bacterium]|nr:MAG: transketolase [Candidatus Omnitrophota bacterium]